MCFKKSTILLIISVLLIVPIVVHAQDEKIPAAEEEYVPERAETTETDIFGRKKGYFHPFIGLGLLYTDNVFRTKENEESDFAFKLSPGIWLAVPGTDKRVIEINTFTVTPGGLLMHRERPEIFKRYQTYFLYQADLTFYSEFEDEDTTEHLVEGNIQYNLKGGLTIDVFDQFRNANDLRGTGITTELDEYNSNLLSLLAYYKITEKLSLRADYSNFIVDYVESRNDFRDRTDDSYAGFVYFDTSPKTSIFAEYEFVDIDYDTNTTINSQVQNIYGGILWDITDKTKGRFKAGYQQKDFDNPAIEDNDEVVAKAEVQYELTPKTFLEFSAFRDIYETTIEGIDLALSHGIYARYKQRFTERISGNLFFLYRNDNYEGETTFTGVTGEREDDFYTFIPSLIYEYKELWTATLSYTYEQRDSNFTDFDYKVNTILLSVLFSI